MSRDLTPTQSLSKRVFNAQHRLDIAAVLLAEWGELMSKDEVAAKARTPPTAAHTELHLLADIGAAIRVQPDRTVLFASTDGPFWGLARQLLEQAAHDSAGRP